MDMHGNCGSTKDAWSVSVQQDAILSVVTWTAMMLGHVKCSHLGKMRWNHLNKFKKKVWPDCVTFLGFPWVHVPADRSN